MPDHCPHHGLGEVYEAAVLVRLRHPDPGELGELHRAVFGSLRAARQSVEGSMIVVAPVISEERGGDDTADASVLAQPPTVADVLSSVGWTIGVTVQWLGRAVRRG